MSTPPLHGSSSDQENHEAAVAAPSDCKDLIRQQILRQHSELSAGLIPIPPASTMEDESPEDYYNVTEGAEAEEAQVSFSSFFGDKRDPTISKLNLHKIL